MKVKISIQNMVNFTNLVVDDETNKATLNGQEIKLDIPYFVSKLVAIVSSWKSKMINDFIVDGEIYLVKIENEGKIYTFEGRNKFPENYREFKKLLKNNNILI